MRHVWRILNYEPGRMLKEVIFVSFKVPLAFAWWDLGNQHKNRWKSNWVSLEQESDPLQLFHSTQ
jgi:hypothetical protein